MLSLSLSQCMENICSNVNWPRKLAKLRYVVFLSNFCQLFFSFIFRLFHSNITHKINHSNVWYIQIYICNNNIRFAFHETILPLIFSFSFVCSPVFTVILVILLSFTQIQKWFIHSTLCCPLPFVHGLRIKIRLYMLCTNNLLLHCYTTLHLHFYFYCHSYSYSIPLALIGFILCCCFLFNQSLNMYGWSNSSFVNDLMCMTEHSINTQFSVHVFIKDWISKKELNEYHR